MIKLNNKNITYVALADSNNSVKGVKEVWYADSNNSVKLVYRRKDALIEGEDYEKYHWLEGDGNAYINTEIKLTETDVITTKIIATTIPSGGSTDYYIVYGNNSGTAYNTVCALFGNSLMLFRPTKTNDITFQIKYYVDTEYEIVQSNTSIDINNQQVWQGSSVFESIDWNCLIFASVNTQSHNFNGKIAYFSISSNINLIPCKLLKPVPKWLDANGIRRQVGECGMIDLISGKFYGNVNSVGTFTVENYYERKEWLQGRNGAYIDTNHKLVTIDDAFEVHAHYDKTLRNEFNQEQEIFGFATGRSGDANNLFVRAYISGSNGFNANYYWHKANSSDWGGADLGVNMDGEAIIELKADENNYYVNYDGVNVVKTPLLPLTKETYGNVYLFNLNDNMGKGHFNGDIAYFKITDTSSNTKMNLIPCTLTMDLPASMDANNIARTKGTSGMWDLVSDRFYGNVANSGTFKAVNLAEGVDYEVYDWLQGDGTAYIEGIQYNLWDNHIVLRVGKIQNPRSIMYYSGGTDKGRLHIIVNTDTGQSEPYLMVTFRELDSPAVHIADIRPFSSMPDIVDMDFYISNSTFYCEQNGVIKTNNPSQTAIENSWSSITPKIQSSKMSYIREVLPNDTYRSNLIPVKLLRSIPSKYDANGIARQANECGMYDTVNDVFYGNVASSGTFTVEDDN